MRRIFFLCIFAMFAFSVHATAVWNISLNNVFTEDPIFSLTGQFTTVDVDFDRNPEQMLSFQGILNGNVVILTALNSNPAFDYDNTFYGPTAPGWPTGDAFDNAGIVLSDGLNIYSQAGLLIGLYDTGVSEIVDGTISLDHVTSVNEPDSAWLWFIGAFLVWWIQLELRAAHKRHVERSEAPFWRDAVSGKPIK